MRLKGQVAIVTGAGQGIGQAIALTLAKEGASMIVNDVNLESAKKVVDDIKALGGEGHLIKADVSKAEEVNKLVNETLDNFKKIDILVNNAGWSNLIPAIELTETQWDTIVDINLKSQFLCSQAVAKHMFKQKRGKIVNIAALSGRVAMPGLVAYGASKAGVLQLTRVLAIEWAEYNINVNAVSPGITMTPLAESAFKEKPDVLKSYLERIPLKRAAKPEDIANAVLFLASSEADDITGQEITIDGGTSALHPGFVRPTN
jgi:NAD(P)-dependent dehydrogenase (short-subunit alcohol dehydrogenase family)